MPQTRIVDGALEGASLTRAQFIFSFSLVTCLFFLWGLSYGLVDSLNAHVQTVFNVSKAASTGLQAAYFGSYLVMAPWAGLFMRRFGFKNGIHVGLALFSLGTIMYWPSAVTFSFPGLVVCTFITASGLAWLEIAANTYIAVLAPPGRSAMLLNLAQAFNGLASVIGPLIASKAFYSVGASSDLHGVQYTYLAVSILGILINISFKIAYLPEVKQTVPKGMENAVKGKFLKQYHTLFGAFAEFFYTGAQVAVASLTINYIIAQPQGISHATAANMYASCQASFTAGRFLTVPLLRIFDPSLILGVYGTMTVLFSLLTGGLGGVGGIVCLYFLFFFEGIQYPTIYSLGTANLGNYAKFGGALIASCVSGGAWYPAAVATFSERKDVPLAMTRSYMITSIGFCVVAFYGYGLFIHRGKTTGDWTVFNRHESAAQKEEDVTMAGPFDPISVLETAGSHTEKTSEMQDDKPDKGSGSVLFTTGSA